MERPLLVIATVSNMPLDPQFNDIIASCRHMTGIAERFELLPLKPRQAIATEKGLFAEAMALAKGAALAEEQATRGMGILLWRLAPETANPTTMHLVAFAGRDGVRAYPLGFATTDDQYEAALLMARNLYGTSSFAPPVICLSARTDLHRMIGLVP